MKQIKLFTLLFTAIFGLTKSNAQTQNPTNANINIVTANAGLVSPGGVIDLSVSVANTGANPIQRNRVRPNISIPIAIASALPTAQQTGLPAGWIVTANTGGTITICNGTDVIPAGETRVAVIKIEGTNLGGPSLIAGALQFGPGTAVCTGLGSLNGDAPADNSSNTTITVTNTAPLNLLNFNATVFNCKPTLNWATTNEVNTFNFEIERNTTSTNTWEKIGTVNAQGNSSTQTNYSFVDPTILAQSKVLYRLKMVDLNGANKYSPVLPVIGNCNKTKVLVYPNPVTDNKIFMSISGFQNNAFAVLKNASGQILTSKSITNGTDFIDATGIANGVYFLSITDANKNSNNIRVIIQK